MRKIMKITEKRVGIELKRKKEHSLILILLFSLAILIVTSITVERLIYRYISVQADLGTIESSWLGSVASYWGGVIGGLFSGSLAFIGVVFTIRYYKKQSEADKRNENMPFIEARITSLEHKYAKSGPDLSKSILIVNPQKSNDYSGSDFDLLKVQFENIGKGFAHTLTINTGENIGGNYYNKLYKVNDTDELLLKIYLDDLNDINNISFALQYIDCMTNEYVQEFTIIRKKRSKYTIECGYPIFLGQIHSIGTT